jgi:hypothetical protein
VNRIYDALPLESRTGRVQMLMPAAGLGATQLQAGSEPLFSKRHTPAAVLHLAATGDHGFSRRLRLGAPLLQQVRTQTPRVYGVAAVFSSIFCDGLFHLTYQVIHKTTLQCNNTCIEHPAFALRSQQVQTASPAC